MRLLRVAAILAVPCFGGPVGVRAESLDQLIAETVENHDRLLASKSQVEAARQRSLEALGVWYPELDVTAGIERYKINRSQSNGIIAPGQEVTASITQLLWDFGASNATVERARLEHVQSEISVVQTRQELTAEALAAYINLIRSSEAVVFAQRSEENIRRQTGLEEARIEAGSGLSTDLLQAKTQLAGAQARRVDAEGSYELALNRYRAVFGDVPADVAALPGIDIDRTYLPTSLTEAIDLAFKGNPEIRITSIDVSLAQQDRLASQRGDFTPSFDIVGEHSMTKNESGTIGRKVESSIKLELSFPFNLGFTAVNTLRAAQSDVVSASRTMGDLERTVEERVRNAWKSLETAQLRSGYLFDQAGIARAFLEVAIQERQLGQRSLIDVLSGETSLINAQSDAISAEADVLLAIVELLAASGALDYGVIETVPRPDRSEMLEPIAGLGGGAPDPVMDLLTGQEGVGTELDPSALQSLDSLTDQEGGITPPPGAPPVPPARPVEKAPPEPPQSSLSDPRLEEPVTTTPDPAPETPAGSGEGASSLRDALQSAPSFDALPRPDVPPEPPRADVLPALEPETEANPETGPDAEPDAEGDPSGGVGREDGDLDNPLFDWAQ